MDYENINGRLYFDFDKNYSMSGDSFFDVDPKMNNAEKIPEKNRRPVFKFSAVYSKPAAIKANTKKKFEPQPNKARNVRVVPGKSGPKVAVKAVAAAPVNKPVAATSVNKPVTAGPVNKPVRPLRKPVVPVTSQVTRQLPKDKAVVVNNAQKRKPLFVAPRPAKQLKTCPTTPECLKRSMYRASNKKPLMSSEDLELEHIAQLRKEMTRHLESNKATLKRVIQAPAMKPIIAVHNAAKNYPAKSGAAKPNIKAASVAPKVQPNENARTATDTKKKVILPKFESFAKPPAPLHTSTPRFPKVKPPGFKIQPKKEPIAAAPPKAIKKTPPKGIKKTPPKGIKFPIAYSGIEFTTKEQQTSSIKKLQVKGQLKLAKENIPENSPSITSCSVLLQKLTLEDVKRLASPAAKTSGKQAVHDTGKPLRDISGSFSNRIGRRKSTRLQKKGDISILDDVSDRRMTRSQLKNTPKANIKKENTFMK